MDPSGSFPCPACGWEISYGTPTCGNCGTDLRPYHGGPLAGPTGSQVPTRLIRLLLVGAILVGAGLMLRDPIGDAIEGLEENLDGFGTEREAGEPQEPEEFVGGGYRNVRALARVLNEGGLRCRRVVVDQSDGSVSTGSCRVGTTHVQINIYHQAEVLRSALDIFKESSFTWVHGDGWFVITQPPVARRVHEILGGRLRVAR